MAVSSINLFPKKIKDGFRSFWSRGGTNEFYPGGADDQRRFGRGKLARDIAEIMKENRHRMLLGDSRYIYQAFSTVSGAVNQKANYVFGNSWQLKSHSSDKEFAKSVEEDFKKIDRMLDTRGRGFSFRNNVWLASKTIDTDGDFLILLTEDEESGFPKLQFIESHRLGNFEEELNQDNLIKDGPFKGRRIFAGVIVDSLMQPVAYRIKDESRSRGYQDVPANGVIHVANIEWFSQTRGQPTIAAGILDW
jgi:capsid protein